MRLGLFIYFCPYFCSFLGKNTENLKTHSNMKGNVRVKKRRQTYFEVWNVLHVLQQWELFMEQADWTSCGAGVLSSQELLYPEKYNLFLWYFLLVFTMHFWATFQQQMLSMLERKIIHAHTCQWNKTAFYAFFAWFKSSKNKMRHILQYRSVQEQNN